MIHNEKTLQLKSILYNPLILKEKIKGAFLLFILVFSVFITFSSNSFSSAVFIRMCALAISAVGVDILVHQSGLVTMGSGGFFGIGGYCAAICITSFTNLNLFTKSFLSFFFCLLITLIISLIFGFAVLKLKGDYLALCTLGLGEILKIFFENLNITGGAKGIFGIEKYISPFTAFLILLLSLTICFIYKKSNLGLLTRAVRDDETAAASLGIKTKKIKLICFCFCSVICALGGLVYASNAGFINPQDFTFSKSIDILAAVVLGGGKSSFNCIIAAFAIEYFAICFQSFSA
ncbi:MAG: branched-chain amino acid ABC transporter permease, partial [Oscillospiraceae bacterium]